MSREIDTDSKISNNPNYIAQDSKFYVTVEVKKTIDTSENQNHLHEELFPIQDEDQRSSINNRFTSREISKRDYYINNNNFTS